MTAISNLSAEQRINATTMSPKQFGMIAAETTKLGWTWAEVALFANLHFGYPYHEIGKEAPMSLTNKEAWELCNYLSQTNASHAMHEFEQLKGSNPDVVAQWQQYWAGRGDDEVMKLTQPVHRECPECHRHYTKSDANFCMVDGIRLKELGVCSSCGERLLKPAARFCIECGAPQTEASVNTGKVINGPEPVPNKASNVVAFPSSVQARPSGQTAREGGPFADDPEDIGAPF